VNFNSLPTYRPTPQARQRVFAPAAALPIACAVGLQKTISPWTSSETPAGIATSTESCLEYRLGPSPGQTGSGQSAANPYSPHILQAAKWRNRRRGRTLMLRDDSTGRTARLHCKSVSILNHCRDAAQSVVRHGRPPAGPFRKASRMTGERNADFIANAKVSLRAHGTGGVRVRRFKPRAIEVS